MHCPPERPQSLTSGDPKAKRMRVSLDEEEESKTRVESLGLHFGLGVDGI
jgi:hypothetical protein